MLGTDLRYPLLGAAAITIFAPLPAALAEDGAIPSFEYHHAQVLGTALDLTVVAPTKEDADAVEKSVLAEIQRLQKILSSYEPDAELSKLNASPVNGPGVSVSPELIDVLKRYDDWSKRTSGAYSGHVGDLIAIWTQAETSNHLPSDADLLAAAKRCQPAAWEIDEKTNTVRRIGEQQINVDSIGKGYIIDKAVDAATRNPGKIRGLLLNIGGDLRTWGTPNGKPGAMWKVGVQDPSAPELNAKPLTTIYVPGNTSVSSSGAYQRFYTIDGKRYSHILDARTGKPSRNQAATVVAADSATANALATIGCAMKVTEAMELARSLPNTDMMVVTSDGSPVRTDGFKELQDPALVAAKFAPKQASQFPAGYKLSIDLETTQTQRKPYVFVWITDSNGRHVRTLAAYGNEAKYWRDMREWWKVAASNRALQSTTHATQRAGKYPLTWDGTDQRGSGVPLGKYNVWVEVASEHGPYAAKFGTIELGKDPASVTIAKSSAFLDVKINYGPGAK